MRERAFAAGAVAVVAVCCGAPALVGALLGGIALAAIVRATALALLLLAAVAAVAIGVVRHRRCHRAARLMLEPHPGEGSAE